MKKMYKILIVFALSSLFIFQWTPLVLYGLFPKEKDKSIKYMLIWSPPPNRWPFKLLKKGQAVFKEKKCPVNNCYVTPNRALLKDLTDFDVILFNFFDIVKEKTYNNLPKQRSPKQIYVFVCLEPSAYYIVPKKMYDNYFNMTWTYKLDSDVYFGYITIKNKSGEVIGPSENMKWLDVHKMLPINETFKEKMKKKNKAGAWFVSNCNALSNRQGLIKELQTVLNEYDLTVDVYGPCGSKKCPKDQMNECLNRIKNEYYFYFSLENSFGIDYVTEKLLTALNNFAVPVVYGGADYNRFMPDGIYLDARNLTRRQLAEEIVLAMNDVDKYYNYFKWHNHYSYHKLEEMPTTDPFCNLCDYINRWNGTKVVQDFEHWWNK